VGKERRERGRGKRVGPVVRMKEKYEERWMQEKWI
jgi:hypothetical protein